MGNNLCATWQKGYRDGCDWPPRKDAHLIRLWAEIFEVREENNEILWGRVSDDVVPVNVVCIQDSPETIYQITAYNRLVEKIFDVYLTQPGTRIIQASDCFVHWRDTKCDREWGLNFTVPLDARRFRECCMKTSNVKVGSNQTSPLTQSHCGVTGPRPENNDAKHVLVPATHVHHPADLQQHCSGIHAMTSAPQNGQQVQVRQVLSVYVDNRCRCGADRHALVQAPDRSEVSQHRPQSFPAGAGLYGSTCPELGSGLYGSHLDQEAQCCHCLAQAQQSGHVCSVARNFSCHYGQLGRHCHVADDNAINQSIYMSAKEARVAQQQQQQHQQLLHEKSQALALAAAGMVRTKDAASKDTVQASQADTAQLKDGQKLQSETISSENFSQKRHYEVPSWSPMPPVTTTSLTVDGAELPASFDSVTLKRMLRSLSGSPPLESTGIESKASSQQGASLESNRASKHSKSLESSYSSPRDASQLPNAPLKQQGDGKEQPVSDLLQIGRDQTTTKPDSLDRSPVGTDVIPAKDVGSTNRSTASESAGIGGDKKFPANDRLTETAKLPVLSPDAKEETMRSGVALSQHKATEVVNSAGDTTAAVTACPDVPPVTEGQPTDIGMPTQVNQDVGEKRTKTDDPTASKEATNSEESHVAHHQRMDSGSWAETPEVRRLTMSDLSGSDCGSDGEGTSSECSSIYTLPMQVAFISPSMAVRKAGWLMVKNWLVHRKRSVELASKRTWNKYWVCLKGNVLLFHVCDDGVEVTDDRAPKYKLVLEGALAQAVPEHPKKENIFSLSTAFGDAYLLQATNNSELRNWINALHVACTSSLFRQHGRENILRLLQNEVHRMESSIDLDLKMKKMAMMHLMTVNDAQSRHAIDKQITQWEENLEKLYVEHYRLRCYVASMKLSESPNPKTLLSYVSKNTKTVLGRVGVFTVNAFHALVCARAPLSNNASVSSSQKARCLLSTFKADTLAQTRTKTSRTLGLRPGPMSKLPGDGLSGHPGVDHCGSPPSKTLSPSAKSFVRVRITGTQVIVTAEINDRTTVQDLMEFICNKQGLNVTDHFLQLKLPNSNSIKIPDKTVQLYAEEYDLIELCMKLLFQIELVRSGKDRDFGFKIEAELTDELEHADDLCIFISEITRCGMAYRKGLVVGDEILVINGELVTQLDMVFIEIMLQDLQVVCLTVRSCRVDRPNTGGAVLCAPDPPDAFVDSAVTSPATSSSSQVPGDRLTSDSNASASNSVISERTERAAEIPDLLRTKKTRNGADLTLDPIEGPQKVSNALPHMCRHQFGLKQENTGGNECPHMSSARPLSNSQRICKVILELIDTERLYVRDLMCLIERYLEPLKQETYLSCEDINQLFGNIQEIVQFQKLFLHSLEEAVSTDPNFNMSQDPDKFKRVLVLICSSFLYYAHHFKLYSSFCASHSKAQKMILSEDNVALQEFLKSRNPKQQHSATLESYLIKPIQRIVKYPLLLKQLYELTDPHSEEHYHLREALHGMEAVAEHINEMQKIYEEYGGIFEELMRHQKQGHACNKGIDLNVGELQMYGTVNWINAVEELGKLKKSTDLLTLVFIFKSAIVLLAQERQKFKKKMKASTGRPPWGCDSSESTRFKLAIPVDQLQVRTVVGDANDRHGIWEIVHCHSEKEGRPKKVYQFISSHKARNDFIRTIHHTMHESVRRISVASLKTQASRMQQSVMRQHSHPNQHPHPCAGEMDNASTRDTNSNVAEQGGRLDLSGQLLDLKDGCVGGASSPVRRGLDFQTGTEAKERGTSATACSVSPNHRSRQHPRDASGPPNDPTSLSPRQTNGAK